MHLQLQLFVAIGYRVRPLPAPAPVLARARPHALAAPLRRSGRAAQCSAAPVQRSPSQLRPKDRDSAETSPERLALKTATEHNALTSIVSALCSAPHRRPLLTAAWNGRAGSYVCSCPLSCSLGRTCKLFSCCRREGVAAHRLQRADDRPHTYADGAERQLRNGCRRSMRLVVSGQAANQKRHKADDSTRLGRLTAADKRAAAVPAAPAPLTSCRCLFVAVAMAASRLQCQRASPETTTSSSRTLVRV